ncbi:MAG: hypothetical protein KF768_08445 [Phycisphaeraceae bacterium]|nr:hypothetical protein [Phycisphaeraceae bacterium]
MTNQLSVRFSPIRGKGVVARAAAVMLSACGLSAGAGANPIPFSTVESSHWLLVGMGPVNTSGQQPGVGQAVNVNNFELGANKAPTPAPSNFLNSGGGPSLLGNVPNIPLNARPVASGICGNGNIAITHANGVFNLQDVGVYGDRGVWAQRALPGANAGTQNSFFNDPNHFPNTFTSTGFTNPGVHNNTGGFGTNVNPGQAVQSTRMDANNYAGVTGGVDHSALRNELASARTAINGLVSTQTLNVSGSGGTINSHTTITLQPGLNVIDIVTGGNDFKIENSNFVIDGPEMSAAIFRLPSNQNMLISNANVLIGNGGIDLGAVMFYTDRQNNNAHFNFSNTVLNGVVFWSLGLKGGEINIDNAQGCTQLIADKITLNDVRFCGCAFDTMTLVPSPGAAGLLAMAGLWAGRRRRSR